MRQGRDPPLYTHYLPFFFFFFFSFFSWDDEDSRGEGREREERERDVSFDRPLFPGEGGREERRMRSRKDAFCSAQQNAYLYPVLHRHTLQKVLISKALKVC